MYTRFNEDIVKEIVAADSRGASKDEMRNLYIRQNVFNIGLDEPIYRIIELQYFREDLSDKCLSYKRIDKQAWDDTSENPLLGRKFKDEVTGGNIDLDDIVDKVYGSCWSATALDNPYDWAIFSHGNPSVRVQSTPRKLLDAVMSIEDPYFNLHHYIGKMEYRQDSNIENDFADSNWGKHLDSGFQGIIASFLQLSDNLSSENEVRLFYVQSNDDWCNQKVRIVGKFAKVPFNWATAIDGVVVGPFTKDGEESKIREELRVLGINCMVSSSPTREYVG